MSKKKNSCQFRLQRKYDRLQRSNPLNRDKYQKHALSFLPLLTYRHAHLNFMTYTGVYFVTEWLHLIFTGPVL